MLMKIALLHVPNGFGYVSERIELSLLNDPNRIPEVRR